jgi:hypothetical protein
VSNDWDDVRWLSSESKSVRMYSRASVCTVGKQVNDNSPYTMDSAARDPSVQTVSLFRQVTMKNDKFFARCVYMYVCSTLDERVREREARTHVSFSLSLSHRRREEKISFRSSSYC